MYPYREHVLAGGLISYGASLADGYRQVGLYVIRILRGANPSDLPVLQIDKFDLVIKSGTGRPPVVGHAVRDPDDLSINVKVKPWNAGTPVMIVSATYHYGAAIYPTWLSKLDIVLGIDFTSRPRGKPITCLVAAYWTVTFFVRIT